MALLKFVSYDLPKDYISKHETVHVIGKANKLDSIKNMPISLEMSKTKLKDKLQDVY